MDNSAAIVANHIRAYLLSTLYPSLYNKDNFLQNSIQRNQGLLYILNLYIFTLIWVAYISKVSG